MSNTLTVDQVKALMREVLGAEFTEKLSGFQRQIDELKTRQPAPAFLDPAATAAASASKGVTVARIIRAIASGHNDQGKAVDFATKAYGADALATKALAATDFGAGGAMLPTVFSQEVIEFLRPMTVVLNFGPRIADLSGGNVTIPKIVGGATGAYVGENQDIPVTQAVTGDLTLSAKKCAAETPISNDFLRRASALDDTMIRDDLASGIAQTQDGALIRGAGTQYAPRGLRYWAPAANVIPATAGQALATVTTDLSKLILALKVANVKMLKPGWIMAPRIEQFLMSIRDGNGNYVFRAEMLNGTLWGFPYKATTLVPTNLGSGSDSEVYLVDFADAIYGDTMRLEIKAFDQASYTDPSTGSLVSAAQRDQTLIRAITEHDFGMRHDASVAILTGVTWA